MIRNGRIHALLRFLRYGSSVERPIQAKECRDIDIEQLIKNADHFRDSGQYAEAAEAYRAAIDLAPGRPDLRVQYGNMLKEAGRLADAEAVYRETLAQAPDDADVYLQLGHAIKLQGRRAAAVEAYLQAAALAPFSLAPKHELFHMGHRPTQEYLFDAQLRLSGLDAVMSLTQQITDLRETADRILALLPEVTTQTAVPIGRYHAFQASFDVPAPPNPVPACSFGIVLLADREPLESLRVQIATVRGQEHQNWMLRVVGSDPARRRVVEEAVAGEPRISWVESRDGENQAIAEWRAACTAGTEWLLLLAPGVVLHPRAIAWFAAAARCSATDGFIPDEELDEGTFCEPSRLRPELRQVVDYDTLLEANVFGETIAVRHSTYGAMAELAQASSVVMARSLVLLALAQKSRVGHIPCMLVRRYSSMDSDPARRHAAHENAVRMHLAESKVKPVEVGPAAVPFGPLSIRWRAKEPMAAIAAIIPTRDNGQDLERAATSLKTKAAVPESVQIVVVDNGSRDAATCTVLDRLEVQGAKIIAMDEPFNWSRLNNQAVAQVDAPLLVFVNDDVQMLTKGWDEGLRGLLERPDIGAVGARLLYSDDSLQHGGILFGWPGSLVIHDGRYESKNEPGPTRRWHVTRSVSAATGAFLGTRRELFQAHGGFDEVNLPVAYNDIDYALKLRRSGFRILWVPQITLYHFESKSRGLDHLDTEKSARNSVERAVIKRRWGGALESEPSLNPAWHRATLPFRLLVRPSQAKLWAHIRQCAERNPWAPSNDAASAPPWSFNHHQDLPE